MKTPPVIVIFGITGDLSKRKLLPALYHLLTHDLLDPATKIIGTSRRIVDEDTLLSDIELCVLEDEKVCDPVGLARVKEALEIVQLDPSNAADYEKLADLLDTYDNTDARERIFYMAVPPDAYIGIIQQLGDHKLNDERTRLLVEKPFGNDLQTAETLIASTQDHFK